MGQNDALIYSFISFPIVETFICIRKHSLFVWNYCCNLIETICCNLTKTIVVIIWVLILFVFFLFNHILICAKLWNHGFMGLVCVVAHISARKRNHKLAVTFRTIKPGYGGLNLCFMIHVFTGTARDALSNTYVKSKHVC
jgi:hypothetical protein